MRLFVALFSVLLAVTMLTSSLNAFVGITDDLAKVMEKADTDEKIRVNIMMDRTADYGKLIREARGLSRKERRERAVFEMRRVADETQAELRSLLAEEEQAGRASNVRVLLGVNGINAWVTKEVIEEAILFEGVRSIDRDEIIPDEFLFDISVNEDNPFFTTATDTGWGVKKINAPQVWDLGITGAGVLVGILDSGVNYNHVDLADHLWNGGPLYPNHGYDFYDDDNDPMDESGHGTQCAGIVAGDGTAGTQTGVAPDATVMCLRIGGTESTIWAGSDFAILHGAHVISSSYSWKYPMDPDYVAWRDQAVAELAAGLIRANSIGNQGNQLPTYPIPYNIATPGNCPAAWLHPDQTLIGDVSSTMGCGAVEDTDIIKDYSGRGPAAWERADFPFYYQDYPWDNGNQMGLLKPDVCAPTDVPSLSRTNNTGYTSGFSGTSAATPHLGGAMCLILSADTMQTPEIVTQRLQMNAVELGDPGKDNVYGAGRIDVFAAITSAQYSMVTMLDYQVVDSVVGDNDGRVEVGETADLILTLKASGAWADADSVTVTLSTADTTISIVDSTSYIGLLLKDSTATNVADPLTFTFVAGEPHWTQLDLNITAVPENFDEDDSISMIIGQPSLILVDDDAGATYESYYKTALDTLVGLYDEWEIETQGSLPVSGPYSLVDHEVAIWFTGNDTSSTILTDEDTTRLGVFLDGGGKFFISSQNLGRALSSTFFYQERLHADFLNENADNNLCTGVSGDEIGDTLRLVLQGSGGAGNADSEDRISPRPGADSCFYYTTFWGASAIKYDSGIYKVVYFGFPFEAIHQVSTYAGQDTVMARILKWLWEPSTGVEEQITEHLSPEFSLKQGFPNPFRSSTSISYSISTTSKVDLSVFDSAGRLVKDLATGRTVAGVHIVHWDGTDNSGERTPAGVYFVRLITGDNTATRKLTLVR